MSRKKKKDKQRQIPLTETTPSRIPQHSSPSPASISTTMKFEAMEDQIRGEEMLLEAEHIKNKEQSDLKKKLDNAEVDRRLEELRKQLGLPKK